MLPLIRFASKPTRPNALNKSDGSPNVYSAPSVHVAIRIEKELLSLLLKTAGSLTEKNVPCTPINALQWLYVYSPGLFSDRKRYARCPPKFAANDLPSPNGY